MARTDQNETAGQRAQVTPADMAGEYAAELPDREAMSLLMPTGGLPLSDPTSGSSPTALPGGTTGGTTPYTSGTTDTAMDQTATAQHLATTSGSDGTNVPNGTATASSTT